MRPPKPLTVCRYCRRPALRGRLCGACVQRRERVYRRKERVA